MRAPTLGTLESTEAITSAFWSLAPQGMILLRLALRSPWPLRDAVWVQSNPAAQRLVPGPSVLPGLRLRDLCEQDHPFIRELLRWEEPLRGQLSLSREVTLDLGGESLVLHVDAAQRVGHLMLWLRDVTAERRELEASRRGLALFQRVMHCAPDAIFAKDLDGRYTLINPAGARALGSTPADVIGHTDHEIFPRADADATLAHDRQVLEASKPLTYEDEDLAGQRVWQSTKGVLRDGTGAITGLFGISRDVTEHKRMERALHENEARHRLVARATRDVLWEWNLQGELCWSSALGEVFGEAPPRGRSSLAWWRERIHPEDQSRVLRALHSGMEGKGEHWTCEYRFRRGDGSWAHVLERGYIGRQEDGRPERLIGAMMDVSERKQREEEKAREAELIERLIGIVSHDLSSPIAAIRLSAQLLGHASNLTAAQHNVLGRIEECTRRVTRLTQQLLDSARARSGGIPVRRQSMDLAEVCRRVLDEFAAIYPRRDIGLQVEGDSRGDWDADRLAQLLSNLLGNALEHGVDTQPVHVRLWDEAGVQRLEVSNQGAPIDAAVLPHLFEPFRVGGRSGRRQSGGGVGLGLFIVQEIARAHQGEVRVRSSREEGTTFGLVLPRRAPDAPVS